MCQVIIHSNATPEAASILDAFVEAGYSLKAQKRNLVEGLSQAVRGSALVAHFVSERCSHETDLVCLLIMWSCGGACLDANARLLKPPPKKELRSALSHKNKQHSRVNGVAMMFEKGYLMLCGALEWACENYGNRRATGPKPLTMMTHKNKDHRGSFQVLNIEAFHPLHYRNVSKCLTSNMTNELIKVRTNEWHRGANTKTDIYFVVVLEAMIHESALRSPTGGTSPPKV